MKYRYLLAVVLAVFWVCVGCTSSGLFAINADQTVSVNVTDMPITEFIDLLNETYEQSGEKVYPLVVLRSELHQRNRETNLNPDPLISLYVDQISTSNLLHVLVTQHADVVLGVYSAINLDPARVPLSQGGGNLVEWEGLSPKQGMAVVSQAADLLKTALGNSVNVKVDVMPRQLEACPIINLSDDLSPMSVNDFVQFIEALIPVIFDFTDEGVVIRFNEDGLYKPSFPNPGQTDASFFLTSSATFPFRRCPARLRDAVTNPIETVRRSQIKLV